MSRSGVKILSILAIMLYLTGCRISSSEEEDVLAGRRSLPAQLLAMSRQFFGEVARYGTVAQSYYTLFIPENSVHPRYLLEFRETLERSLRRASAQAGLLYQASAEKVFFLSRHDLPGWQSPSDADAAVLASEFRNGTSTGWTVFHAFWSQYHRLSIGNNAWVQNLPESVRADLSSPLKYVLRVSVFPEDNPNLTTYVHKVCFDLVEVGRERVIFSQDYPVTLEYSLR